MTGVQQASRHEIAAALGWLVEAGVDTLVDDVPFAWLAPVGPVSAAPGIAPAERVVAKAKGAAVKADSLAALAAALTEAHPAALFADGTPGAAMIIGDRPTAADAKAGRVFGDLTGTLLDRMLASIGLPRGTAYLANTVAWPLAADRSPNAGEIAAAAPYLRRQIVLARPKAILALGQTAATALTGSRDGINRLRGKWHDADIDGVSVAVMPTFHPAQLLLHPGHKAAAWADLLAFRARVDG